MFDSFFDFKHVRRRGSRSEDSFLGVHIYHFKTGIEPYIVEVEEYEYHVYAIKFYPKSLSNSPKKYNKVTNKGSVSKIISTCVRIMLDIVNRDPLASLCFKGTETGNEDSAEETKRFRIYRNVMRNLFSDQKFTHYEYAKESIYLLLSLRNHSPDLLKKIEDHFGQMFEFEEKE